MDEQAIVELNEKLDALHAQVAFLAEEAMLHKQRRQEWDDLKNDLTPVAHDVFRVSIAQLEEVEGYVQLEDVLRLLKRMMRNTRNLEQLLDQMESLGALQQDLGPLSQDAFLALMRRLDEMERKGYFAFLQGGMEIVDQVVLSFGEDDVRQLGDNIVLILQTVKEMTQPEIMRMMRNTATVMREEEPAGDVSMLSILRQLNDPAVRRGLSKTLAVLRSVSERQSVLETIQ